MQVANTAAASAAESIPSSIRASSMRCNSQKESLARLARREEHQVVLRARLLHALQLRSLSTSIRNGESGCIAVTVANCSAPVWPIVVAGAAVRSAYAHKSTARVPENQLSVYVDTRFGLEVSACAHDARPVHEAGRRSEVDTASRQSHPACLAPVKNSRSNGRPIPPSTRPSMKHAEMMSAVGCRAAACTIVSRMIRPVASMDDLSPRRPATCT